MNKFAAIAAAALGLVFVSAGLAQDANASQLEQENAQLRQRVDMLESQMLELKSMVKQSVQRPVDREDLGMNEQELADLKAMVARYGETMENKKLVWSSLDIQLYGYIKLDASYDTARTVPGNFTVWVAQDKNDNQFNMTANQTRLGMKINGPATEDMKTRGVVETDFYGGGAENSAQLRMRHAYMEIEWPKQRLTLMAGQYWEIISPYCPPVLNFGFGAQTGNIGFRRPQIRITKVLSLAKDVDLKLEFGGVRPLGQATGFDPGDSGEDGGAPALQARASLSFPFLANAPTVIGFHGSYGWHEWDLDPFGRDQHVDTWSTGMDLIMPVTPWMKVSGEMFMGANLSGSTAGIGQGVNPFKVEEIRACGGWLALSFGPFDNWNFNVGAMVDSVNDDDLFLMGPTARKTNKTIFGNVIYDINSNASVGLELSHLDTDYVGDDGEAFRIQTSFIYKF